MKAKTHKIVLASQKIKLLKITNHTVWSMYISDICQLLAIYGYLQVTLNSVASVQPPSPVIFTV